MNFPRRRSLSRGSLARRLSSRLSASCLIGLALVAALFAGPPLRASKTIAADTAGVRFHAYVSVGGEGKIAIFELRDDGALVAQGKVDVGPSPGAQAVDPKRRFVYASLRNSNGIATLRIDRETGGLTKISEIPAVDTPTYLAVDHTGQYLLSAYYSGAKAAVHRLAADGTVEADPVQLLTTDKNPHSILMDSTNRWVFVPNTGANLILQFAFDARSGRLTPAVEPRVDTAPDTGPRHVFFHPTLDVVYFVNEKGGSVTAFRLDRSRGTLTAFQTLSTLPDGYTERNACADVEVTPSGRYLYASNRGHDSLAGFAIDPKSGALTALGQTPTEKTPRSFNIDPTGRYLIAAGQGSGRLQTYRIDEATGHLDPMANYEVGPSPGWVTVVPSE